MVTLKQLSKELGVSVSTVSKALNDSFEIGKDTKKRVLELAKKYNYTPNNVAVNLRSQSTKTIGVIIPNIFNHFYTKILSGIEAEAKKKGYRTLIYISNEKHETEVESIAYFLNGSVDGILLAPSEETQKMGNINHFENLKNRALPFVVFDREIPNFKSDLVRINDAEITKKTIQKFIDEGRKNIVVFSLLKNLSVGKERAKAIKAFKNVLLVEEEDEQIIEQKIETLLKDKKVDAVLGLDEVSSIITLNLARKLNYNIPENLSIIGFSQGVLSKYSYPKLSTINQHSVEIGKKSVELLLNKIKKKTEEHQEFVIEATIDINET